MSRAFIQKRTPFKPTDIGGCQQWLDGADATTLTLSGSIVTQWRDKSGSGNNATPVYTGPTLVQNVKNSLPGLSFSGGNIMKCGAFLTSTSFSAFIVVNNNSGTKVSMGVWKVQYGSYIITDTEIKVGTENSSAYSNTSITIPNFTTTHMYAVTLSSSSAPGSSFTYNGSYDGLNTVITGTSSLGNAATCAQEVSIGGLMENNSPQYMMTGYIHEVIFFSNALTSTQRQQVESYLAQKWGLRQQLPQGHPGTRGIVYPSDPVNLLVRLPYPSAFVPTSISNCSMWLDGTDPAGTGTPPSNGATVSTWVDKSGSGINLTAVGTPTYVTASSSVYLNGSSYLQNTNFNFTNYTIFFVSNQASDSGPLYTNNTLTTISGQSGFFPRYSNGNYYLVQSDSGWLSAVSPFSYGITYLYSIQYDSLNNINLWSNGSISPTITGTAGSITRNKFLLGKRNMGFTENMTGNIFEVVQYNSDLGQTSRQQVEGYLAWKWGLQANLPANHPYKSSTPDIKNARGISRPVGLPVRSNASIATPNTRLFTVTFTYTGTFQSFTVPSTISPRSVNIYMWGAGGGTSQTYSGYVNYNGGAGAMVQGVYTVTPGSTLYIVVGLGGSTVQSAQTDAQGGGGGVNAYGGGGGGRSAIQLTAGGADVVVAGGGGGGGLLASNNNGTGGPSYYSGTSPATLAGLPAYGGSQTAGGAGTSSPGAVTGGSGSLKFGGTGTNNSCSGGGGYYGGGGSGNGEPGWDPGAGGSSLIDNLTLIPGQSVFGYNSTNLYGAPNTGSPYYQSNIAAGGIGGNATGGNGLVVITYYA